MTAPGPSPWTEDARRQEARAVAKASNRKLNFADSDEEAAKRAMKFQATDPFPSVPPALLNSADIADYAVVTGMLYPFYPDKLKTASYEVALLGRWFYIDGNGIRQEGDLKKGETVDLPKNSIAFMSVEPYFRLPDYIALRHNLKIDHIYKGLLVGTGPLIDPGFTGKVALPLHNLTENTYRLTGGQGIIWIEFTKLSPNMAWTDAEPPVTRLGSYTNFPAERSREKIVDDYVTDGAGLEGVPASSSAAIEHRAMEAKAESKSALDGVRTLSTTSLIGFVAAVLTIAGFLIGMAYQIGSLSREVQQLQDAVQTSDSATTVPIPTPTVTPSTSPATP